MEPNGLIKTELENYVTEVNPEAPPYTAVWFVGSQVKRDERPFQKSRDVKKTNVWTPFEDEDSTSLELAWQNGQTQVVLSDRLQMVDLTQLEVTQIYWIAPVYPVIRGIWFMKTQPVSQEVTEDLEKAYMQVKPWLFTPNQIVTSEAAVKLEKCGKYVVFHDQDSATILFDWSPLAVHNVVGGITGGLLLGDKVIRGYTKSKEKTRESEKSDGKGKENDKEERPKSPPPKQATTKHLLFAIHGIGQKLGSNFDAFVESVGRFRKSLQKVDPSFQVLPICWRPLVSFGMDDGQDTFAHITLSDIAEFRSLINDCIADVLLYLIPKFRFQMLRAVSGEMNRVYHQYRANNPDFDGKCHIFAHSLGTMIAFDVTSQQANPGLLAPVINEHLLSNFSSSFWGPHNNPPLIIPKLDFPITNLFMCGSPVGLFLVLRGVALAGIEKELIPRPACDRLYNISHPNDPIGYRLEPLVNRRLQHIHPRYIDWTKGGIKDGINKMQDATYKMMESFKMSLATIPFLPKENKESEDTKPAEDSSLLPNSELYDLNNRFGRIDFLIHTGVLDNPYLNALSAHFTYFDDQDVVSFVIDECTEKPLSV